MAESVHVEENRRHWDAMAEQWVKAGEVAWSAQEPSWGVWHVPESTLSLLPSSMRGMDAIELGCGTGYVSAWMARRGARVTAIDNSEQQLQTARRLARDHGVDLTLLHGNAEQVPRPDGSFDFAISEYGAAIWCDPYAWIPEAHRLLRPGGGLVFLGNHPIWTTCAPPSGEPCGPQLSRDYFGMHRIDWRQAAVDPGGIEFNLPLSAWFALFFDVGFVVERYQEVQAPADRTDSAFGVGAAWAQRWPAEQVFHLRKVA